MKFLTELRSCKWYFLFLLLLLSAASLLLLLMGKAGSFISLNSFHPFYLNVFFINFTFFGDGIFAICLIAACVYYKRKQPAAALIISFLLSSVIVQVIKNCVAAPRPKLFFEAGQYLYFIDGVTHSGYSSFPSGHTATAFAIATVIVMLMKNKKWQIPVLVIAGLVAYSRIYLAQHFVIDIIIGAITGTVSAIVSIYILKIAKQYKISIRKIQSGEVTHSVTLLQ
jgi:membrane-associated phospholipid phosphatase